MELNNTAQLLKGLKDIIIILDKKGLSQFPGTPAEM